MADSFKVAIVSGKLGDVDGVSLEVDKWIRVLTGLGHLVSTIAGKYAHPLASIPAERQFLLESIRFDSEEQRRYERLAFPNLNATTAPRDPVKPKLNEADLQNLQELGSESAARMMRLVQEHEIDALIAENTNAMPMTLIGGLAVWELAVSNRVATMFHHHDFWWERSRFSHNRIEALLDEIMPPSDVGTEHVVLTSYAAHILRSLKRVQPRVIPNCEDFDTPPVLDEYALSLRSELGFTEHDLLVVQPTRIVRRKRIEDSIRFVGRLLELYPRLTDRLQYVISLYQGDEDDSSYVERIKELAAAHRVRLHLIADRVASMRATDSQGRRVFTNRDVLANADLVTYLPVWEGFGNALLEAIAARVPVVTTTYLVYKTDIKIAGLTNVEVRDVYDEDGQLVIRDAEVEEAYRMLTDPALRAEVVERNFAAAKAEFGTPRLTADLAGLMDGYSDEMRASRRRIRVGKRPYAV